MLARQLFERFLAEAAAQGGGGSEDGEAAMAGASAGAACGGLSPVSESARYSEGRSEEQDGSGAAQHSGPAPSPVPDGLAFNPLFGQGPSDQQEAAAGEAGHPAAQEQLDGQHGSAPALAGTRRVKLLKRERAGGPAAGGGTGGQARLVGGKRKASVEAPQEAVLPATKRQARKSGGGGPGGQWRGWECGGGHVVPSHLPQPHGAASPYCATLPPNPWPSAHTSASHQTTHFPLHLQVQARQKLVLPSLPPSPNPPSLRPSLQRPPSPHR